MTGYLAESALVSAGERSDLTLETASGITPAGEIANPQFFSGFLARPEVAAGGLLTVADVAATRYFDLTIARRSLDPVVTASGDRLRFESFSGCNGVHARLDLLSDGIDSGELGFGTTNVDINQPLRTALAATRRSELLHVAVGADALTVSTPETSHVEREVELPDRWVRGFAETPVIAERMTHRATLPGAAISRFLASLPQAAPGPSYHLVPMAGTLRQSLRPTPGSIHLAGTARLTAASRIARFATSLQLWGADDGASGWVFDLPGARLTLLMSPEPYRGFSGEGGLLADLARTDADDAAARISEFLAWEPVIDPEILSAATGLDAGEVRGGLSRLATSGKVGYDLAEQAWFHRELPADPDRVVRDNPRLVAARKLLAEGAVTATATGWELRIPDRRNSWDTRPPGFHSQFVTETPDGFRCSCVWWAKYGGARGVCKHVLAVTILRQGDPSAPA